MSIVPPARSMRVGAEVTMVTGTHYRTVAVHASAFSLPGSCSGSVVVLCSGVLCSGVLCSGVRGSRARNGHETFIRIRGGIRMHRHIILGLLALLYFGSVGVHAQSQPPAFEVATIRPSGSDSPAMSLQ